MKILKNTLMLLLASASIHAAFAEALPETIRFGGFGQGFGKPFGLGVLAIAQDKGFIAEEFKGTPVKFTFEYFTGTGPAINEAIASGKLDFAQYGSLPNIIGKANGLPTRILSSYGNQAIFAVARKGLPIKSIKDLKGYRVGVAKGTVIHWAFLQTLADNGLTQKDVQIIDLKGADQLAALTAGSIDVSFQTSSVLRLRDEGVGDLFYTSKTVPGAPSAFGAVTVTEAFEKKYPEATQKIANGIVKAAYWLSQEKNREEALKIWEKSGTPAALIREDYEGVSLKDSFNPRLDPHFINLYNNAVAFTKEQKLIRRDFDVPAWFATNYVENALKAQHLSDYWPTRQ